MDDQGLVASLGSTWNRTARFRLAVPMRGGKVVMQVNANFYGGNIEVVGTTPEKDVLLEIRPDPTPGFRQWWYFSISSAPAEVKALVINNAEQTPVPMGWPGYQAFRSLDNATWSRVPTSYAEGRLVIEHSQGAGPAWYAYFP